MWKKCQSRQISEIQCDALIMYSRVRKFRGHRQLTENEARSYPDFSFPVLISCGESICRGLSGSIVLYSSESYDDRLPPLTKSLRNSQMARYFPQPMYQKQRKEEYSTLSGFPGPFDQLLLKFLLTRKIELIFLCMDVGILR